MPITGPDVVLMEKRGHIAYITLNRPERLNAISGELGNRLAECYDEFNQDESLWVSILTGTGRAFSAGADLKDMNERGGPGGVTAVRRRPGLGSGLDVWKPTIAAINGFALAGGWNLAQQCDIRIAADTAQFGITEVKWNLPAGWCVDVPRIIGLGHALEIVLVGDRISAQRAYEIGFVNRVVPADRLMDEATALAERICENGPMSVRMHKEILYRGTTLTKSEGQALGRHILAPLNWSEDSKEGPKAFVEKRKPQWKGR